MILPISNTTPEQTPEVTASTRGQNNQQRSDEFRAAIAALALGLTGPEVPEILNVGPSSSTDLEIELEPESQFEDQSDIDYVESDSSQVSIAASQVASRDTEVTKISPAEGKDSESDKAETRAGGKQEDSKEQVVDQANSSETKSITPEPNSQQVVKALEVSNAEVGSVAVGESQDAVAEEGQTLENQGLATKMDLLAGKAVAANIEENKQISNPVKAAAAEATLLKESVVDTIKTAMSEALRKDIQGLKSPENSQFSQTVLPQYGADLANQSQQSLLTGILIRQAMDSVKFNLKGGLENNASSKLDLTRVVAGSDINLSRSVKDKNPRLEQLPKPMAQKAMLRVEQVLKEAAMSKDGKTISFRLDPPQLGQVKVEVSIKSGELTARLTAENQVVNNLLWEQAPELQKMLRKLGLNVDRVQVSVSQFGNSGLHDAADGQSGARNQRSQAGKAQVGNLEGGVAEQSIKQAQALPEDHWVA